jgi:lysophospholipase L1-like esterase
MNKPRLVCFLGGIALLGACSSSGTGDGTTGSGGNGSGGSGSGGTTTTGGNSGSGTGGSATGGTPGTGGGHTGGAVGTGGAGSGGTGGNGNTGGATGTGGSGAGGTGTGGTNVGGHGGSASGGASGTGGSAGATGATHWVGTWAASPYYDSANQPPVSLANGVIRQITHVSIGGSQLRVQFSNLFGNGSVTIKAAHIALCKPAAPPLVDSNIDTATDTALAFSGTASVTIAQGKEVWSDPVSFTVPPLGNVTITTAFGAVPSEVTGHSGSRTDSYIQSGSSTVTAASMASATSTEHWYFISGIDVMAPASYEAAVAIGDSITDGRGSDINENDRWTDDLSARLQAMGTTSNVAMLNQGIGATDLVGTGTAAQARYSRDVLGQDGVRYAIIYDGVNDILGGASFASMQTVYASLISQGHAKGLLVYGATITPFGAYSGYSAAHEAVRQQVNTYIRSGAFDGVLDFDAAVTDGGNPPKLQAQYATWSNADGSGDGLHPSPAGYVKMADSVDLTLFTK